MKKFAVFDIDGTLVRWQLYHAVVDKLAKKNLLGEKAGEQLHKARMVWKNREHPEAFREYEMAMIKIYEQALLNLKVSDFDDAVEEAANEYKTQVYTYTRDLVKNLKGEGYVLLAISGSHQELIRHIAEQFGFDDWVGSVYEREGDHFSGKATIASFNKKATLEKLIKKHGLDLAGSVGVGDSKSDADFLQIVEKPIAFNPDQALLAIAKSNRWPIVVERKNVVYELEPTEDGYLLA